MSDKIWSVQTSKPESVEIQAEKVRIDNGCLIFEDIWSDIVQAFAPGVWLTATYRQSVVYDYPGSEETELDKL